MRYTIATILLFLTFGIGVYAQSPNSTPDPVLQACEEAADLAKRRGIEIDGLKSQLAIRDERLALKDEQIKNKEEQLQFWKIAFEKSSKIDTNATLVIENLRTQVNDYRLELTDLRRENDSLRSSRNWRTIVGTGLGFGAGYYFGNKR